MSAPRTKEDRAAFEKEHGRDTRTDLLNKIWDLEGAVNRNGEEMVALIERIKRLEDENELLKTPLWEGPGVPR